MSKRLALFHFIPLILVAVFLLSCDEGADEPSMAVEDGDGQEQALEKETDASDGETISDMPDDISPNACRNQETAGATARCLTPKQSPEYYIEQSLKYFDTLDIEASEESIPNYAELVARWEWPPWLLLTGYGKETMESTAKILRQFDPSTVPERDCRAFDVQPFGRCYVVFEYEGGACPIYEEFTFDDEGEMTFIEAWSDLPGMRPMEEGDKWAQADDFPRLSTRIPGLGNETGTIALENEWMNQAAQEDEDIAEFQKRAGDQWKYWWDALQNSENLYERGCGW